MTFGREIGERLLNRPKGNGGKSDGLIPAIDAAIAAAERIIGHLARDSPSGQTLPQPREPRPSCIQAETSVPTTALKAETIIRLSLMMHPGWDFCSNVTQGLRRPEFAKGRAERSPAETRTIRV